MDGMSGIDLQDRMRERNSPIPIAFITGHGDVPMAVDTMKKGAMDFIQKPFKEDELVPLVERMLEQAEALRTPGADAEFELGLDEFVDIPGTEIAEDHGYSHRRAVND